MFKQYVSVTWHNGPVWVERLVSDNPITIDDAVAHYLAAHDFNEDRDSLEFVDAPETINLGDPDDATDTLGPDDPADPADADVCPESGNGKHLPDWASTNIQWDGDQCYVDVNCGNCGASGCIGSSNTLTEGINW